jgi:reactive intermediate/imine deaminase
MSRREIIHTDDAPAAIGPYSQAVRVGDTVYLSGQIALDPASMTLVEGGIEAQTRRVFDNLTAVCRAAGGDLADVVKLQIYLPDLSHFETVNGIMKDYLTEPFPARAALGVRALPKGAEVEIDGVMVLPE